MNSLTCETCGAELDISGRAPKASTIRCECCGSSNTVDGEAEQQEKAERRAGSLRSTSYVINGQQYSSLEDIPSEVRGLFQGMEQGAGQPKIPGQSLSDPLSLAFEDVRETREVRAVSVPVPVDPVPLPIAPATAQIHVQQPVPTKPKMSFILVLIMALLVLACMVLGLIIVRG